MIKLGIQIIPDMAVQEVGDTIRAAEELGYDFCLLADEGFMPDVYVCLGAAAQHTARIRLGPVTNGYTRHPAVTAAALATLNEISGGRALATLVAGGSMVLPPMGILRESPLTVVRESLEVMRRLWTGEAVTWQGQRYRLEAARLSRGAQTIPVWLAVRGDKLLELAGREADGVMLMAKSDLASAIGIVERSSIGRSRPPQRLYLDRIAYTPEMLAGAAYSYTYAIMDSPGRMLRGLELSDEEIAQLRQAVATGGPAAAAKLVTADMIKKYQIAGPLPECRETLRALIAAHQLDGFVLNIVSGGLAANIRLMTDTRSIVNDQ